MSNALAIAAAMRAIAALVDAAISAAGLYKVVGSATTTVQAPDRAPLGDAVEVDHLNLFLYSVTMNSGWRNIATVRDSSGARIAAPPLAVDLHFMMTAYGAAQYHPEMLLGVGMQALHEQPFLDRAGIASLFSGATTTTDTAMAAAALDQQVEQVKIAPHDLSADEIYKLWSAFGAKCRPSASYVATVVLIESAAKLQHAPPVMSFNLAALPVTTAVITAASPSVFDLSGGPVQVTLTGSGMDSPIDSVRIGGVGAPITASGPTFATFTTPAGLKPGVNLVEVVQSIAIGAPPAKPIGLSSGLAVVVQPLIGAIKTAKTGDVDVVQATVVPPPQATQSVALLLDQTDAAPGIIPNGYRLELKPAQIFAGVLNAPRAGLAHGTYLARVEVDGCQSVPAFDPVAGFTGPTVVL